MPLTPYYLRLLGPPIVENVAGAAVDFPLGKPFAILCYLALEPNRPTREELATLLWTRSEARQASGSVRTAIHTLRSLFDCGVSCFGDPVELPSGLVETDVARLEGALDAGDLDEVLTLWRGPLLDRFALTNAQGWETWLDEKRSLLEQRCGAALRRRGEELWRAAGNPAAAIPYLAKAVEVQAYQVEHHITLGEALLALRRFSEVEAALAAARPHAEDRASSEQIRDIEERVRVLRRGAGAPEHGPLLRPEFVGRTDEFAELLNLWRDVRRGTGKLALLLGAPGIGKSRLAEELAVAVRTEGGAVVPVKAMEVGRPLHWALVADLVRELYARPGSAGVSNASDALLHALVPSLGTPGNGSESAVGRISPSQAAPLADALADLIGAVAHETPLLIVVDDLQWADPLSRSVLALAARRLRNIPCLLIFTCRSRVTDPALEKTLSALQRVEGTYHAELRPLRDSEVIEMLGFLAEGSRRADLGRLAARIQTRARGNPLFVVELLKVLYEDGVIAVDGSGRWTIRSTRMEEDLPLPANVRALLQRRLEGLTDDAATVVGVLASYGGPRRLDEIASRSALSQAQLTRALNELLGREILRWGHDDRVEFTHDEYRTVAEGFRGLVPTPGPDRRGRRATARRAGIVLIGLLIVMIGWIGLRALSQAAPPIGEEDRVAVFPFVVRGASELEYLGPGLTTLLSASLHGVGALSTVDPPALLTTAGEDATRPLDPAAAAQHARRLGASSFVLGELIGVGARLRLRARWYDVEEGGQRVAEAMVEGEAADIFTLTDRLAAELLAQRTPFSGRALVRSAARTTASLPALQAYLQGEQFIRTREYRAAVESFRLALALDSTFALAAYRLAVAADWADDWPAANTAVAHAERFSDRLPPREQTLVQALRMFWILHPGEALRLYQSLVARNPGDLEAWYWLGRTQYNHGALMGVSPREAQSAFERVLGLDPTHHSARTHLIRLAAWSGDHVALDSLVQATRAGGAGDSLRWLHLRDVALPDRGPRARLRIVHDTLADPILWQLAQDMALYTQNYPAATDLARKLTDARRPPEARVAGHLLLAFLEQIQGRPRAARRQIAAVAPLDSAAFLEYSALFATPHFLRVAAVEIRSIREVAAAWEGEGTENPYLPLWTDMYSQIAEYLLGVLSVRLGDRVAAQQYIAALEETQQAARFTRLPTVRAEGIQARLAFEMGDAAAALSWLTRTPPTDAAPLYPYVNYHERQLRPRLVRSLGRKEEALRWYAAIPWRGSRYTEEALWDLVYLAPSYFERAELLEELGHPAEAAAHYERFLALWRNPEPELRPQVEEARRRLTRLRQPAAGG